VEELGFDLRGESGAVEGGGRAAPGDQGGAVRAFIVVCAQTPRILNLS